MDEDWQQQVIERLYRTHTEPLRGNNEQLDFQQPFTNIVPNTQHKTYFGNALWDMVTFWRDKPPAHDFELVYASKQNTKKSNEKETPTTAQLRNIRSLRRKYQPLTYKQNQVIRTKKKSKKKTVEPFMNKNNTQIIPTLTNQCQPIDFYTSYPTLGQQLRRYVMEAEHMASDATRLTRNSKLHDSYLLDRELQIQLKLDPNYVQKLTRKLSQERNKDQFLEKEMKLLLEKGKSRESQIQKSVRMVSQYMMPETSIESQLENEKGNQLIPLAPSYRVQRELELNKRIMNVFDDHPELFEDPFGLGLEPSIQVTHPLSFDAMSVFDRKEMREAPPARKSRFGRSVSNRNVSDTIPMIPRRKNRTSASLGGMYY
jgi:hypothetical protein